MSTSGFITCNAVSDRAVPLCVVPCRVVLDRAVMCCTLPCCVVPCHVVLDLAVLCTVLCRVVAEPARPSSPAVCVHWRHVQVARLHVEER